MVDDGVDVDDKKNITIIRMFNASVIVNCNVLLYIYIYLI